jgi:DNA-binding beta-propeller fold protein YncE
MRTPRLDGLTFSRSALSFMVFFSLTTPVGCRFDDAGKADPADPSSATGIDPDISPRPATRDARPDQAGAIDAGAVAETDALPPAPVDAPVAGDLVPSVPNDPPMAPDASPIAIVPPPAAMPPGRPVRCDTQRSLPVNARHLGIGPSSDDITFDREGHLISFDRREIVRVLSDGSVQPLLRNVIGQRGGALRVMTSGDVVVGDFAGDAVLVGKPAGQLRALDTPVVAPMKMVHGPRGTVYVTGKNGTVYRIDPAAGAVSAAADTRMTLGGLTFSLDYKTLYVSATDTDAIYALDVQGDGSLGAPRMWRPATDVSALATDECGRIYVLSERNGVVRRMSDGGGNEIIADLQAEVPWSLAFGSGQHGWSDTSLYVLVASGGPLFELPVGVSDQPPPVDAN